MAIKYTEPGVYMERTGESTVTIEVIPVSVLHEKMKRYETNVSDDSSPESSPLLTIEQAVAQGITHLEGTNHYSGQAIKVSYDDIMEEFNDIDFSQYVARIVVRFAIDHDNNEPLYPSDMIEAYRQRGMEETEIERLLEFERQRRNK